MTGEGTTAAVSLRYLNMGILGPLLEIDMSVYPTAQNYPICHAGGGTRLLHCSGVFYTPFFSEVMDFQRGSNFGPVLTRDSPYSAELDD
jgi:hypothetical protein